MALDEHQREELAHNLEAQLGSRTAALLMASLSPEDHELAETEARLRAELASKSDLEVLEHRLVAEIHRTGRTQLLGFASIVALMNTALAAFGFLQS